MDCSDDPPGYHIFYVHSQIYLMAWQIRMFQDTLPTFKDVWGTSNIRVISAWLFDTFCMWLLLTESFKCCCEWGTPVSIFTYLHIPQHIFLNSQPSSTSCPWFSPLALRLCKSIAASNEPPLPPPLASSRMVSLDQWHGKWEAWHFHCHNIYI